MKRLDENGPFPLIFGLVGFCVLCGGVWWVYRPAALILAGVILMTIAFLGRSQGE